MVDMSFQRDSVYNISNNNDRADLVSFIDFVLSCDPSDEDLTGMLNNILWSQYIVQYIKLFNII